METGIKIIEGSCKGCVNCIKSCPTEALRVVDGKVRILSDLCIDCGNALGHAGRRHWHLTRMTGISSGATGRAP